MRILVIEDEVLVRERLRIFLTDANFVVDTAADGKEGIYVGLDYPIDLAIVDVGLPLASGLDVLRTIRAEGRRYPVLVLTARSRWEDKVEALDAGADDYVTKPFQLPEILARVHALLRRTRGWATSTLSCGPIVLDIKTQRVAVRGTPVKLTSFEYRVLEHLMLKAGEIISKTDLTEHLYEQDFERDSNVLEVFVAKLRQKLDPDHTLQPIETLRGRGYRFTLARSLK